MRDPSPRPLDKFLSRPAADQEQIPPDPYLIDPDPSHAADHIDQLRYRGEAQEAIRFAEAWLEKYHQNRNEHAHVLAALAKACNKSVRRVKAVEYFIQSIIIEPKWKTIKMLRENISSSSEAADKAISLIAKFLEDSRLSLEIRETLQSLHAYAIKAIEKRKNRG